MTLSTCLRYRDSLTNMDDVAQEMVASWLAASRLWPEEILENDVECCGISIYPTDWLALPLSGHSTGLASFLGLAFCQHFGISYCFLGHLMACVLFFAYLLASSLLVFLRIRSIACLLACIHIYVLPTRFSLSCLRTCQLTSFLSTYFIAHLLGIVHFW